MLLLKIGNNFKKMDSSWKMASPGNKLKEENILESRLLEENASFY